jgi:hypothetical protein
MTALNLFADEIDSDPIETDRLIEQYHLGWDDHKRGEIRPSHYPYRAEGWDARDIAVHVRVIEVVRVEGYYHMPLGTFD